MSWSTRSFTRLSDTDGAGAWFAIVRGMELVFSANCKLAPIFLNVSVVVAIRTLALLNIVPKFLLRVLIADVALVVAVSMVVEIGRVEAAALVLLTELATDETIEIGVLLMGAAAMVA